ncbi:H-type lectin domain-containing protein [Pacificibacter maritimus]|uniref:H-type lectin domain-containing protein n=1 Tax=Pacificibacter maritimus TaxID=762213 RepID=A0A3N4UDB2_9RHOB|nr:H-type lectin domain-containing protein [Pacificibacter maritimus]RPE66425.1 H-type lectin domain-containing protein [Pacificibacter maritimus]
MQKIDTHRLGIEQDSLLLFSDFQDGGAMWTGKGPRELRRVIEFDEPFLRAPAVTVGLSMLDIDQASNHRVDICAEMVNEEGFVIVFRTWGDTRVARVRADWMALGPVRHDDDWDV